MHDCNIAKLKAIHSNVPGDWDNFKKLQNTLKKEMKFAKEPMQMYLYSTITIIERHSRLSMI